MKSFETYSLSLPCEIVRPLVVGRRFFHPYLPSSKRLKRLRTMFSPVSAITLRTRSPTTIASSFTHGCIIKTCSPNCFLSLPLIKSSRFSAGTRASTGSSRIVFRASSIKSAGTSSKEIYVGARSEEHTSELQSPCNLVCRLLLEKKKKHTQESASI